MAGTFELPCLQMTLRQNRANDAREYSGPGEIRQEATGELSLRLFDQRAAHPGVPLTGYGIVPSDEFFSLTATDMGGRKWTGVVFPDASPSFAGGCEVRGKLRRIDSAGPRGYNDPSVVAELMFPMELALPANTHTRSKTTMGSHSAESLTLDTAEFSAAGFQFHCRTQSHRTDVWAYSEKLPAPNFVWVRIIEGLQFLLGRVVRPVLVKVAVGNEERVMVFSTNLAARSRGINPPLRLGAGAIAADAWRLFDRYLTYVWTPDSEAFHPLSAAWDALVDSGRTSIDNQALILSVAVHTLLDIADKEGADLPPPLSERDENLRNVVVSWLESLAGLDKQSLKRLRGFFTPLLKTNTTGRLNRLVELGAVSAPLIESWGPLRNHRAHGAQLHSGEPGKLLHDCDSVLQLLHQLTFYAIGYQGHCVAYGEAGRPTRRYPPSSTDLRAS